MKTPQEYVNEFFGEIQFVSCPTEKKEPFFWKWTNDGKEIIKSFLLTSLEECGKQCREDEKAKLLVIPKNATHSEHDRFLKEELAKDN